MARLTFYRKEKTMFAITGATGQLGRLVIDQLLERIPAGQIAALVRSPDKAADLAARGVVVRHADYDKPETLRTALAGVERLLLISSSEVGRRVAQHQAAIDAARAAGVGLVAYTSVLRADTSPLKLAEEHYATEQALAASGLPYLLLRNGWYTENRLASLPQILTHNAVIGAAQAGRTSSAPRSDYAAAAAILLVDGGEPGRAYELAGDTSWSLEELAREIGRQADRAIAYVDMTPSDYGAALRQAGLSDFLADFLVDCDLGTAKGALEDDGRVLSGLIGRSTRTLEQSVAEALPALA